MATPTTEAPAAGHETQAKPKLHGRAFYESIGSPKYILAPMVDQSEFVSFLCTPAHNIHQICLTLGPTPP